MSNSKIQKDLRHNLTVNVVESAFFGLGAGFAPDFSREVLKPSKSVAFSTG
ncbi:MAG: hypothetical protein V7K94_06665 [Nostoc sp.]|uniref:hypothetical protein n=1 Tax=Nostoc sp. TaxID=1180 RepID=UPI002FF7FADD